MREAARTRKHRFRRFRRPFLAWDDFSPWNASAWNDFSPWNRFSDRPFGVRRFAQIPTKKPGDLRLFSLNMAHGRKTAPNNPFLRQRTVQRNISAIAEAVRALHPDVVALQEADGPSSWSGNFDHVAKLAELSDLTSHYRGDHNSVRIGRFSLASGTALLARRQLSAPSSHRFGASWRDTKGYVVATIAVPEWDDLEVDVVSVHLDFLAPRIRRKQIAQMVDRLLHRQRPLVVLGDLNCCFDYEPRSIRLLVDTLGLRAHQPQRRAPTYPSRRPWRRLDWILVSEELAYGGYHTVPIPLSDHLMLVADLQLREDVR